jgi:hypothetical protein
MMAELPHRRIVISLSISAINPDAVIVAEKLAEQGVALAHGGGQILAWAAAYLMGAVSIPNLQESEDDTVFGVLVSDIDACLDAF